MPFFSFDVSSDTLDLFEIKIDRCHINPRGKNKKDLFYGPSIGEVGD